MRRTKVSFYPVLLAGLAQIVVSSQSHGQSLEWVKMFGGDYIDRSSAIEVDRSGNSYTTGIFSSTVDFDPGPEVFEISRQGGYFDCYVSKLNAEGEFIWAKSFSGDRECEGFDLEVDVDGNVYIVGEFYGTVDFDPGEDTFSLYNEEPHAGFIVKLDSLGEFIWALRLGSGGHHSVRSIDSDKYGNIYFAGSFSDSIDLDPGPNTFTISEPGGHHDIYACKLDGEGSFLWGKHFLGSGDEFKAHVSVSSESVYLAGNFTYDLEMNQGGQSVLLSSLGGYDMFISRFTLDGDIVWAERFGGSSGDACAVIEIDSSGNVYAGGHFGETVDFDPGANIHSLTSVDELDIVVFKLNSLGELVWCRQINGGNQMKIAESLAIGLNGSVYVGGYFEGMVDFDPGPSQYFVSSDTAIQTYVLSLTEDGDFEWVFGTGGWQLDFLGNRLTVDNMNNVYVTGHFLGTADFDPGPEVYPLTAPWYEIYVQKVSPPVRYSDVSSEVNETDWLYPNPTSGKLYHTSSRLLREVSVIDCFGRVVSTPNLRESSIDLSDLSNGVYLIRYTTEQDSFVQRIQIKK